MVNLDEMFLDRGAHDDVSAGVCAMELVAFIAGEPHSDSPSCTCPVIAAYVRRLNDRLDDADRQRLKPYLPRLIGTADEKKRVARGYAAADWACREFAPTVLEDSGRLEDAQLLRGLEPITDSSSASRARDVALEVRKRAAAADAAAAAAWRERAEKYRSMAIAFIDRLLAV